MQNRIQTLSGEYWNKVLENSISKHESLYGIADFLVLQLVV